MIFSNHIKYKINDIKSKWEGHRKFVILCAPCKNSIHVKINIMQCKNAMLWKNRMKGTIKPIFSCNLFKPIFSFYLKIIKTKTFYDIILA